MIGRLSEQPCRRSNTDSTHFCLHSSRRTTDDNLRQREYAHFSSQPICTTLETLAVFFAINFDPTLNKRQRLTSVRHPQATYIHLKSSNNPHKSTTWVRSTVPSLVPVRSSRRLPRYEFSILAPLHMSTTAIHRIHQPGSSEQRANTSALSG